MRAMRCLVPVLSSVSLAATACAGSQEDPDRGEPAFDEDELEGVARELVDAHNAVRAAATPTPSPPLPAVTWDPEIAAVAQDWAERCVFEHSTNGYGENLGFISGDGATAEQVVQMWASEADDYDYATNSCAAGRVCGHYTQLVWRSSTSIGCGIAECTVDGFAGLTWVCNYDPPGNFVGERPY